MQYPRDRTLQCKRDLNCEVLTRTNFCSIDREPSCAISTGTNCAVSKVSLQYQGEASCAVLRDQTEVV